MTLYYQTHTERVLLAVTSLGKQNLILGFPWLKDHNPKVDWQKGEVRMTRCPPWCKGCGLIYKEETSRRKQEARALWTCRKGPIPSVSEEEYDNDLSSPSGTDGQDWEDDDCLFLTRIFPEGRWDSIDATSTALQRLVEGFHRSAASHPLPSSLPDYV